MLGQIPPSKIDQNALKVMRQPQLQLTCGSNNRITNICIDKSCKVPSLHCQKQDCSFCQPHAQNNCNSLQLRSFTNLIKKKKQKLNNFVHELIAFEKRMLQKVQNMRKELIAKLQNDDLTQYQLHIIQNIFKEEGKTYKFRGREIAQLTEKLKKNVIFRGDKQLKKKFEKETDAIAKQIFQAQKKILHQFTSPDEIQSKIDSKIMRNNNEGLQFIFEQLNYPRLQLLYRASEHQFSVKEFHAKCDQVSKTLVILKTEHDKILTGYTPLKWDTENNTNVFKFDPQKQGFLLSVTERQRFNLTAKTSAIYCSKEYGPSFGTDLTIKHKSEKDKYATGIFCFPLNYNSDNKKYSKCQQTITKLFGPKDNTCFITEYEVYRVLRQ